MKHSAIGSHCILELHGCPQDILNDEAVVRDAIAKASEKSLSTLLHLSSHSFEPHGVTAIGLLAESHISIHTWPELGYAACDIFTCGEATRPTQACDYLAAFLRASSHSLKVLPRGRNVAQPEARPAPAATKGKHIRARPRWATA